MLGWLYGDASAALVRQSIACALTPRTEHVEYEERILFILDAHRDKDTVTPRLNHFDNVSKSQKVAGEA